MHECHTKPGCHLRIQPTCNMIIKSGYINGIVCIKMEEDL